MPISGFEDPPGRRVHSVERALTASALLPTVAFAALGSLTVLSVVQMGISPLGAVGGPSARDGGHAVTMPRMSISIGPPRSQRPAPAPDRETTAVDVPTTLDLAGPVAHTIRPTRGSETTTADARTDPTRPTRPTTLIFARSVAHTIPPTHDRETTTPDVQSAAMPAAVIGVTVANAAVTISEVTSAAVEPAGQADEDTRDAPEVMYTLLALASTAPAVEADDRKPKTAQNEGTSVASVKTPENTDSPQASEHAKAPKRVP